MMPFECLTEQDKDLINIYQSVTLDMRSETKIFNDCRTVADYNNFDMVIVMEDYNKRNLLRLIGCDCECKVWKLLDFVVDEPQPCNGADISDPWYHGNFDKTYKEIELGCRGLLKYLGY
mgnify:CR=1 FL=1